MITSDRVAQIEREIGRVLGPGWQIIHMTLHDHGEPVRLNWMGSCRRLTVTFGPTVVETTAQAHGTWSAEGGIERCFVRLSSSGRSFPVSQSRVSIPS